MEINENIDIKRIFQIIFSKKLYITLIILLSLVLGYVYSYYYKIPEYESSAKVLLVADDSQEQTVTQTDLNINTSLITTYKGIATSSNVAEKTIKNLDLDMSIKELQSSVQISQVDKTQFLKVSVRNKNPERAKNIANELVKNFAEQIKEIYNLDNIKIVDEAETSNVPVNINHKKDIVIAVAAGIMLSIVFIAVIYFLDDTIKNDSEIEQKAKLRNLGKIAFDKDENDLIVKTNPKSQIVESIKTIRTNVLYAKNKNAILITSANEREGKSWIANNIATTFAQANKKVILVDSNLRKESNKNQIFGTSKQEGLSDFIKEMTEDSFENLELLAKYIQESNIPNLHILTNGTIPPNPSELVSSDKMKNMIKLLKKMYDVILIDGNACLDVSDSIALSTMVDSTIIVAENKKTKISDLKKIKKSIEDVNGSILGVILNKAEFSGGKYYGKSYGYYYGHEVVEEVGKIEEKNESISLEKIIELAKERLVNEPEEYNENIEIIDENIENQEEKQNQNITQEEIKNLKQEIRFENSKHLNMIDRIKKQLEDLKKQRKEEQQKHYDMLKNIKEQIELSNTQKQEMLEEQEKDYELKIKELKEELETTNNQKLQEQVKEYEEKIAQIKEQLENKIEERIEEKIEKNNTQKQEILEEQEKDYELKIKELKEELEITNNQKLQEQEENYKAKIQEMQIQLEEQNNQKMQEQVKNYEEIIKNIREELQNNNNQNLKEQADSYNAIIEEMKKQLNNFSEEIKTLKELQDNSKTELLEKIETIKIDNSSALNIVSNENTIQEQGNIINMETWKKNKRKTRKKTFNIAESINYEDLENMSNCVINLTEELNSVIAMSN